MAHKHLILPPHYLPWHQGGVDFLLADSDLPPEFSLCHGQSAMAQAAHPKAQSSAPAQYRQQRDTGQANQVNGTATPYQRSHPPQQAQKPPHASSQGSGQAARQQAARQQSVQSARQAPVQATQPTAQTAPPLPILPPDHWPRIWQQRLAATRPAPVLWTYWALGEDLCVAPNAARRDLLRKLLGDLGHPAGTHSFWPSALPGENGLEAHSQIFWSGVDALKARALVVMGLPAVKALELPARLRPFQQTRHNGRLVVVLRDADFLVQEPQHYEPVREFLRQALAPFARG